MSGKDINTTKSKTGHNNLKEIQKIIFLIYFLLYYKFNVNTKFLNELRVIPPFFLKIFNYKNKK